MSFVLLAFALLYLEVPESAPTFAAEHMRPTQHVCRLRNRSLTQDAPPNTRSCCLRHL